MEFEIKSKEKGSIGLGELWEYRELFYFFTWRDLKVKYKQTTLGVLWAIFQPAIMTLLFSVGFGKIISSSAELNVPYPVFVLSGFLLWNIFSNGLSNASNSMVNNSNIIKKIYFPRLIIPISAVLVSIVDFIMAFFVFIPVLLYYGCSFNKWAILFIPISVILIAITTFGLGTFLAALNIKYRDFRYILPFFIQILLFTTPVIYPVKVSNNKIFQLVLELNPMNAPMEIFRAGINDNVIDLSSITYSMLISFVFLVLGVLYFRKTESYFADLV